MVGGVEFILLFTHARQIDITTLRTESREELEVRGGSLFAVMSYVKSGVCSFLYVSYFFFGLTVVTSPGR